MRLPSSHYYYTFLLFILWGWLLVYLRAALYSSFFSFLLGQELGPLFCCRLVVFLAARFNAIAGI
jgi:hypothetical protein